MLVGGWSQASSREASVALAPGPPMGAGCGVCFCRPSWRLRACVLAPLTGFHLIGVVLEHGGVGGCWLYWEVEPSWVLWRVS